MDKHFGNGCYLEWFLILHWDSWKVRLSCVEEVCGYEVLVQVRKTGRNNLKGIGVGFLIVLRSLIIIIVIMMLWLSRIWGLNVE